MLVKSKDTLSIEYKALRAFQEDFKKGLYYIEKSQKRFPKEIHQKFHQLNNMVKELNNLVVIKQGA